MSPGRAFALFLGITAVNPTTVVYFAAVVLGNRDLVDTPAQGVVFVLPRSPRPPPGSCCWPGRSGAGAGGHRSPGPPRHRPRLGGRDRGARRPYDAAGASLPAGVTIRRAVPADAEALSEPHLDCWDEAYTGLVPQEILAERRMRFQERIDCWRGALEQEVVWLAERDGYLIGFSGAQAADDADFAGLLELRVLYVRAAWWARRWARASSGARWETRRRTCASWRGTPGRSGSTSGRATGRTRSSRRCPRGGTCGWCDSPERTECRAAARGCRPHDWCHRINRSPRRARRPLLAGSDFRLDLRLLVRDPERSPDIDCDVRVCEYADEEAAVAALRGIDTLFMVSASEAEDRREQHRTFIRAAGQAGGPAPRLHLVPGAAPDATFTLGRDHHDAEVAIRESGLTWTFLRDNFYLDILPLFGDENGVIRGPADQGRVAAVARADIAEVAVEVLRDPAAHADATYTLTGRRPSPSTRSRPGPGPCSAARSGSRTSRSRRRTPPGGRRTAPRTGS